MRARKRSSPARNRYRLPGSFQTSHNVGARLETVVGMIDQRLRHQSRLTLSTRRSMLLHSRLHSGLSFDGHCHSIAATEAKRCDSPSGIPPHHFMQKRDQNSSTTAPDRMA
jgi:hypothetical protein